MSDHEISDIDEVDFFTDPALVADPFPYYQNLHATCPVYREPHHGVLAVTGYDEAVEVYRDTEAFSSCNSVSGPFAGLPEAPESDDISALIEQYRGRLPMGDYLVTLDDATHEAQRALLRRLFTPNRLKRNEAFMWRLADRQIDEFLATGKVELINEYARPFTALVIADLLGVPEEDHQEFRTRLASNDHPIVVGDDHEVATSHDPLGFLVERFTTYIEDRRRAPRKDVLTELATATYLDDSTPEVEVVVRIAAFLFAAGQDTTGRLIASAMRILCEHPGLQQRLREKRDLIPDFIEEALRIDGPVKADFRLARRSTTVGGVDVTAGTSVMVLNGAVNRDPRQFEQPGEFRLNRPNYRTHLAFGRGAHACPGGPLARVEARISFERLLDRMADIRISDTMHGPADARRYQYDPAFSARGLNALHLEFTPAG